MQKWYLESLFTMFGIFHTMLTCLPSYYMERYATIMLPLEFSLKYKIGLQIGKTEFIQN